MKKNRYETQRIGFLDKRSKNGEKINYLSYEYYKRNENYIMIRRHK